MNPGVSIIILTLNAAHHIKRLLDSFFSINTYPLVELIIIDHASADDTAEVIAEYTSKGFIRLIRRDKNHTFSESCNYGAQKAKYPHLLFLNNDIIFTEDALPSALKKLTLEPGIGAVGIRLDDDPEAVPKGMLPGIQHLGVRFKKNEKRGYFQPEQIRHENASIIPVPGNPSGNFPAVTGAFLLCRKEDFLTLNGFSEDYDYGLEDIDFCLRLKRDLKKTCWCINETRLQHVEKATRSHGDQKELTKKIENNHRIFKARWSDYIRENFLEHQTISPSSLPQKFEQNELKVLFVLYGSIDSNSGLHAQLHAASLATQGCSCSFAVPDDTLCQNPSSKVTSLFSYSSLLTKNYCHSFDIIHAWTPREKVRKVSEELLLQKNCPLVIHLEDNEEYLTEAALNRSFAELSRLPDKELDKLIPDHRYHPRKGRIFLDKANGLTLIIETLERFNTRNIPSVILPPPADERLFYPRPINAPLRRELNIPGDHIALAYTGNSHHGNKNEVHELYEAVRLLNAQAIPTVLLRTGMDKKDIGSEAWDTRHVRHLGFVERFRIPTILAAADILVQPGSPGPFNNQRIPSKLPEYFLMGRPVVLPETNLGLQAEHLKEAYVLNKADAQGIAEAARRIWEDPVLRETLSVEAVFFYRNVLYQPMASDKLVTLYHHLKTKEAA